jgi:hypothetical protein
VTFATGSACGERAATERVTGFVDGHGVFLLGQECVGGVAAADEETIPCGVEVGGVENVAAVPYGVDRRLVHEVGEVAKPSMSDSSWLSVCSRSSFEPNPPGPRRPPMASISSMKMIDGARLRASANRSRTLEAPTPRALFYPGRCLSPGPCAERGARRASSFRAVGIWEV